MSAHLSCYDFIFSYKMKQFLLFKLLLAYPEELLLASTLRVLHIVKLEYDSSFPGILFPYSFFRAERNEIQTNVFTWSLNTKNQYTVYRVDSVCPSIMHKHWLVEMV